jgi:rSAM/selenodomain-associated transferase 1
MRHPDGRILVFARAPVAGACKTRLIQAVGARGAARVQRQLIEKTLETAVAAGLAPVELWCAPDCRHPFLQALRHDYGLRLQRQPRGDLGRRMSEALRRTLREARYAVLIGTDCPALTAADLGRALAVLRDGTPAVFQPATDGGYVLVGLSRPEPRLFHGIGWGGAQVMGGTRARLARFGLGWTELPALWDVDHPTDWRRAVSEGLLG